ncbi:MAG: 5-formyltetrahydrofolate cyclo-ligase [Geobacter sp.]|nr:5-formyltetrahydrofolate cyclo-ligase [Geobacter sp.]
MPKRSLREVALKCRSALSPHERTAAETAIQNAFIALPEYCAAKSLALYSPVRGEVATDKVLADALSSGKMVYLPAVTPEGIVFRRFEAQSQLDSGSFGILEPQADAGTAEAESLDLIVVPGVAFSIAGDRIGYGKGYYDKALHQLETKGRLMAFCFECQLVEAITGEPHDVTMDKIITERRVVTPALLK